MRWDLQISQKAEAERSKKAVLCQTATNKAHDMSLRDLFRILFFEEISELLGSLSDLGNLAQMALGDTLNIERGQFPGHLVVIQPIHLVHRYSTYMLQIANARWIFRVVWIVSGLFIGALSIPIKLWPFDTHRECIEGHHLIAPTGQNDPLRFGLDQKCIIETFERILHEVDESRMAPFAIGGHTNEIRK